MQHGRRELTWPFWGTDPDLNGCHVNNNSYECEKWTDFKTSPRMLQNHNSFLENMLAIKRGEEQCFIAITLSGFCFYFLNTKGNLLHSNHKLDTNSDPWSKTSKI